MLNEKHRSYIIWMEFIAAMMSENTEIVLYDVKTETVYHVINPLDDEMKPGSEIHSLEKSFLQNKTYEKQNFIVNYRALSKSQKKLKSGTIFLKDASGNLEAILTINIPVDHLIQMRDMLDRLISGPEPGSNSPQNTFYNSFDVSVENMVTNTIIDEISKYGVDSSRLSNKEKLQILSNLDQKGIFLVKGSISEIAKAFNTTETTIYRNLSKLAQ